jgi:amidase
VTDVNDELAALDATAQAQLVRDGKASPIELVDAAIARVEKLNPELNAVIHCQFDLARERAGELGVRLPDGPFRGVPFVLKDLTAHEAGQPFHEGLRFAKELEVRADSDTELVRRFKQAGFVIIGRTNTPELGILPTAEPEAYGPTRNPWDVTRSTGGSSGGSAAAVASRMVPAAHANDGGGSIRIPASECGLVGLKPSRGRTTLGPDFGDVLGGLVCEHVVTRTVRDTAAILDAVHGGMPGEPYEAWPPARPYLAEVGAPTGSLRIGIRTHAPMDQASVDPECVAAAESAGRLLEQLGHRVEVATPDGLDDPDYVANFITMWAAGNASALDGWSRQLGGRELTAADVELGTWALVELGRSVTAPQWLSAREWLQASIRRLMSWWEEFDLLLTPTIAEPPPLLGQMGSTPDNPLAGILRAASLVPFTPPFNVSGQPAISLPLHWSANGLPIGVQLVAAANREDVLIRVAAQLEAAAPWADRRPPISA